MTSCRSSNSITFTMSVTWVSRSICGPARCTRSPRPGRVTGYTSCPRPRRARATSAHAHPPSHAPGTNTKIAIRPPPRSSSGSPEWPEEIPEVSDEQLRRVHGGEVPAAVEHRPVDDVVRAFGEPPDGVEVVLEHGHAGRHRVRRIPVPGTRAGVLVVLTGRGASRGGQPVQHHVREEPVAVDRVHVLAPEAHEQLAVPGEFPDGTLSQPLREPLRTGLLDLQVAGPILEAGEDPKGLLIVVGEVLHLGWVAGREGEDLEHVDAHQSVGLQDPELAGDQRTGVTAVGAVPLVSQALHE